MTTLSLSLSLSLSNKGNIELTHRQLKLCLPFVYVCLVLTFVGFVQQQKWLVYDKYQGTRRGQGAASSNEKGGITV